MPQGDRSLGALKEFFHPDVEPLSRGTDIGSAIGEATTGLPASAFFLSKRLFKKSEKCDRKACKREKDPVTGVFVENYILSEQRAGF